MLIKLILDFSEYIDIIIIRRATFETNSNLFNKFGIVKTNITDPIFYLITNTHDSEKKFEIFDEFVANMSREKEYNTLSKNKFKTFNFYLVYFQLIIQFWKIVMVLSKKKDINI